MKIAGIVILVIFYAAYLGKMILQKRKGIQTDQMAKGKARDKTFYIECFLKIATYLVVAAEAASIFLIEPPLPWGAALCGAVLGFLGDLIFVAAVVTMRDSWRAGIAENDTTELITTGIYQISRNPAFLGFDCVYIGLVLMFFNLPLLACSLFAMIMLHLQILQEEAHLPQVFGDSYLRCQEHVRRYLGRK